MTENEEWLENYQRDLKTAPVCNSKLISQWIDFYKASTLPEKTKIPLLQILQEGTFMGAPFSDRVIMAQEITPTLERLIEMGFWDDVLKLLFISYSTSKRVSESKQRQKNRDQTKKAKAKNLQNMYDRISPFEQYLKDVENFWHPDKTDTNKRYPRHSKQKAIEYVFNQKKEEIIQEIKKIGLKKKDDAGYKKYFENLFAEYTDEYRKRNNGRTVFGYKLEERKGRSEESRERSSLAAKKRRKK